MSKLFSVLTPAFNRAHLIVETLESVLRQDYRPIEMVIVDDGSSDDTVGVVERWRAALPERDDVVAGDFAVKILRQANAGPGAARNRALDAAEGAYIHYLDSDDLLEPGSLSKLAVTFEAERPDLIFAGFRRFDEDTGEIVMNRVPETSHDLVARALDGGLWGNATRIALTREFASRLGPWDEALRLFEDREYSERAVMTAERSTILPVALVSVRVGGGPRLNDRLRTREGRGYRIACEQRLADLARNRSTVTAAMWSAFRSRIYGLGMRSYAQGWTEHGRACRTLADGIAAPLDARGRRRRLACQLGMLGGWAYLTAGWLVGRGERM